MQLSLFVRNASAWLLTGLLVLACGCPDLPDDTSSPDPVPEEEVPSQYSAKIYKIGDLDGLLLEEMQTAFNFTAYSAGATDAPLVIAGDDLDGLSEADRAGVAAIYAANHPVVLIEASVAQIDVLRQILGVQLGELALPEGIQRVEIYALDHEPDHEVWQWMQYPPQGTEHNPDDAEDQQTRVGHLINWLRDNQERKTLAEQEEAEGTAAASTIKDGPVNQLTELASAFVDQRNFSEFGDSYQISHFIYSFHSVATGHDWFFIQQRGVFNGSATWSGIQPNSNRNKMGDSAFWYMDSIDINSTVKDYAGNTAFVGLIRSSPETANNTEKLSSSMSYSVGGDVSLDSGGPSGKISGGLSISSSRSFSIQDCTENNYSLDGGNNAHWLYVFKRCGTWMPFNVAFLTGPPDLAVSAFQPVNQWIWRMRPEVRQARPNLHVAFRVNLVGTVAQTLFAVPWYCWTEHEVRTGRLFEYDVPLPLPPIVE